MTTLYTFVTGPSGAGKTTFLQMLGGSDGYWVDDAAGLEYCQLSVDESLDVLLFAALEAGRFDPLLEIAERDLLGYIVMVDGADPATWNEAALMVANCRSYALMPMVIAVNKQAGNPNEVAVKVGGLDAMTHIYDSEVDDPEGARNLFLQLLYSVDREIERLDALIAELERLSAESSQNNP
jgi:signal recognition particle receptor subunit beta